MLAGRALLVLAQDLPPQLDEEIHVVAELLLGGSFRDGAHDEAGALGPLRLDDVAQPLALLLGGDAPRDADVVDGRHEDQVPPGSDTYEVMRAPLVPMGSLATWTSTSCPSLSRSSIFWPRAPWPARRGEVVAARALPRPR
jgi:hypothetical protein